MEKNGGKAFFGAISDTEIRNIRVFMTVVECGSIAAAETVLGIRKSTISRSISDLELRLGLRLCHRTRSGVTPTQQGRNAIEIFLRFLASSDDLWADLQGIRTGLRGRLVLGMMDYTASDPSNPLPLALCDFAKVAPEVELSINVGSTREIERHVRDGTYHLGLISLDPDAEGLSFDHAYDEVHGLFAGPNHPLLKKIGAGIPLNASDVRKHALVHRGYRPLGEADRATTGFANGPIAQDTEAVELLVRSGAWIGHLPIGLRNWESEGLAEVLPDVFRFALPVFLAQRLNRKDSAVASEFLKSLKRVISSGQVIDTVAAARKHLSAKGFRQ